jgi:hypothetical protein
VKTEQGVPAECPGAIRLTLSEIATRVSRASCTFRDRPALASSLCDSVLRHSARSPVFLDHIALYRPCEL